MMSKKYINITNKCSANCPFCCMHSSVKGEHMNIDAFINIIRGGGIIQLEGGEPSEHPLFVTFVDLALTYGDEVVIDTNGININKWLDLVIQLANLHKKHVHIKVSYNNYLKHFQQHIFDIASACEFLEFLDMSFNVRGYTEEELAELCQGLEKFNFNAHLFNAYGKLEGNNTLPKINDVIVDIYDDWKCYSSDGECFGKKLKERANYEYTKISAN